MIRNVCLITYLTKRIGDVFVNISFVLMASWQVCFESWPLKERNNVIDSWQTEYISFRHVKHAKFHVDLHNPPSDTLSIKNPNGNSINLNLKIIPTPTPNPTFSTHIHNHPEKNPSIYLIKFHLLLLSFECTKLAKNSKEIVKVTHTEFKFIFNKLLFIYLHYLNNYLYKYNSCTLV